MREKYLLSLKKINGQHFFFKCLIFFLFMKCCICTIYDNGNLPEFGDEKVVSVDLEEIIRRQSVAETYLKERSDSEKDWIETYDYSFSGSSAFTSRKMKEKSSIENDHDVHATFPFQNVDMLSLKNLKDSLNGVISDENPTRKSKWDNLKKTDEITSEEFIRRRDVSISFDTSLPDEKKYELNPEASLSKNTFDNIYQHADKLTKDKTVSSGEVNDQTLQELFKTDKNNDENLDKLKDDSGHITNSQGSKKTLVSSMMESKSQTHSESNKLRNFPPNLETRVRDIVESRFKTKDGEICSANLTYKEKIGDNFLYSNSLRNDVLINYSVKDDKSDHHSSVKNYDSEMNEFKNLSVNTDKIIEIMIKNSKFTSKKYFIDGETLTLTEFYKLQENLAQLSFLQKSKNNIYSVNRMKMINSIGKVKSLQGELNQEKLKQLCNIFKIDHDIANDSFNYEDSIKKSTTDFEKQTSYRIDGKDFKNTDINDFSYNSEIFRRKKVINSFVTTLRNNQKNWIETYHLNNLKDESERHLFSPVSNNFKENKSNYNSQKTTEQAETFSKVYSQERLYIIRWFNKLQNKLKNSHSGDHSLSILISGDLHKKLGELSREFDIVIFDELVNNIISNATFHNNYANIWYFDYKNIFNDICSSLNSKIIYILTAFLLGFIFMHSKNWLKWNILSLSLIILLSFVWHANKMYQHKIAEKHSVMSRVVPSYCESILVQESGALAHFKEYFRSWYHDADCKKYYEAVMVDPSAEITLLSISFDLLSDAMLQPFARNMNSFFKALTYDLSFFGRIFVIITTLFILIVILYFIFYFCLSFLAFRYNYKINFPFFMGSTEPTEFSIGSRVEEVNENEDASLKDSNTNYTSLVDFNNKTEHKNNLENISLKESYFKNESKHSKLEPSKHYVSKIPRTLIRRDSI